MSENRLKTIIGKEYTDNPIVNFLKYLMHDPKRPGYGGEEWRKKE
ncbi:hypothetical protein [Cohnella rhizosphaerae]|uniref:Uncharacterized protein n=1 Tax=Cohnella rhizosphaerae TaxID=1457232 RepID=A0A9X4KP80_9BACL|nr:hypothetical protein [Cohnella rhizosphaerae]MDG0808534.1 hypothetical protein [Cohnella rhizosphaerae]